MSDDNATTDSDAPEGDNLKQLREAADRGKKVPGLERELAFAKAGIDTDTKLGKMLLASYDGELTKEAIRAEATEIGLLKDETPPPPATDPAQTALNQQQQATRDALSGGAPSGDEPPATAHPFDDSLGRFHTALSQGVPRETAGLGAVDSILEAAGKGDKRVLL